MKLNNLLLLSLLFTPCVFNASDYPQRQLSYPGMYDEQTSECPICSEKIRGNTDSHICYEQLPLLSLEQAQLPAQLPPTQTASAVPEQDELSLLLPPLDSGTPQLPVVYSQAPMKIITNANQHTTTSSNTCPTCGKILANRASLKRHLRIHTGEKPFKCTTCNAAFSEQSNLIRHRHSWHNAHTVCDMNFSKPANSKKHKDKERVTTNAQPHHPQRQHHVNSTEIPEDLATLQIYCQKCLQPCTYATIDAHMQTCQYRPLRPQQEQLQNVAESLESPESEEIPETEDESRAIERTFTLLQQMEAEEAEKQKRTDELLSALSQEPTNQPTTITLTPESVPATYTCDHCNEIYTNATAYSTHLQSLRSDNLIVCTLCNVYFSTIWGLQKHLHSLKHATMANMQQSSHSLVTEPTPMSCANEQTHCPICHKDFKNPKGVDAHMRTHQQKATLQCPTCPAQFRTQSQLKYHYCPSRRFICEICNIEFTRPGHLATHKKWKHNEHIFPCGQCNRNFKSQKDLDNHRCVGAAQRVAVVPQQPLELELAPVYNHPVIAPQQPQPVYCCLCNSAFSCQEAHDEHLPLCIGGIDLTLPEELQPLQHQSSSMPAAPLPPQPPFSLEGPQTYAPAPMEIEPTQTAASALAAASSPTPQANTKKRYPCPVAGCLKDFGNPGALGHHMRIHPPVKPAQALAASSTEAPHTQTAASALAAASFPTPQANTKKRYPCPVAGCLKDFGNPGALGHHMRIHSPNTYRCPDCNQLFRTLIEYDTHTCPHASPAPQDKEHKHKPGDADEAE